MLIMRINERKNTRMCPANPWAGSAMFLRAICALCTMVIGITDKQYRISGRVVKEKVFQ